MQQDHFVELVKELSQKENLPQVLEALKAVEDQEVADAAVSLTGQFSLAEIEGEKRIYHVFTEANDDGEEQEYAEWVMNEDDDVMVFVAWFFYAMFEMKQKDTYQAAGRTYQQPKRR
ncbi:hypothetical protein [Photobacterium sanguinicancri]|uniref:Uncharacterized protein n=1 Tax=Photobacterium sanguinicancri TaxID=875932 RepID=A0AAW7Y0S0_9GAMM|nr:hypothetical protein [Photobacterium sanguinicancri]KXI21112.1 hypothetical protein AS132_20800 [Photobacterium sanguinicancri]MDO6498271.1 hypothetical protein [Photobacterium sanguinicancri]MDO6541361.1 hypothetical protein [Photobacterium sanguinicancri]OZS42442.1 hypothetical protein ASV53_18345 [Photobacterium sanguinicancri]